MPIIFQKLFSRQKNSSPIGRAAVCPNVRRGGLRKKAPCAEGSRKNNPCPARTFVIAAQREAPLGAHRPSYWSYGLVSCPENFRRFRRIADVIDVAQVDGDVGMELAKCIGHHVGASSVPVPPVASQADRGSVVDSVDAIAVFAAGVIAIRMFLAEPEARHMRNRAHQPAGQQSVQRAVFLCGIGRATCAEVRGYARMEGTGETPQVLSSFAGFANLPFLLLGEPYAKAAPSGPETI